METLKNLKLSHNNILALIVLTLLAILGLIGKLNAVAQLAGIKRTDLQRQDLSIPGREVVQATISFTPGSSVGNHSHPGEEIIYVLEGNLEYQIAGKSAVTLKAGDVVFVPAGAIHSAKNVGKSNAKELATYVVEKKKPLIFFAR